MTLARPSECTDLEQILARWLTYRIPHFDAMEREAANTLTGRRTAVVRHDFDGTANAEREWHVSLFTRTRETPDPVATFAAVQKITPAGMLLHHIITDTEAVTERMSADPRPQRVARDVERATRALAAVRGVAGDQRSIATAVDRAQREADERAAHVRDQLEGAIADGLRKRNGFLLIPPMIVQPQMLDDWLAWRVLLLTRAMFDPLPPRQALAWRPAGVSVCRSCTTVFTPRRRSAAEYCSLCSKRPASEAVLGQRPFVPGETQTVRAPQLAGNVIVGWKTVTVGFCVECGEVYHGRRDAKTCGVCTNRVRQRRHRARRPSSIEDAD